MGLVDGTMTLIIIAPLPSGSVIDYNEKLIRQLKKDKMADSVMDEDLHRVYWHSRRGMLELDLVLMPFAKKCYPNLSDEDKQKYQRLLACEDQDMFSWLLRREIPEDEELVEIVQKVIKYAEQSDG